MSAQPIESTLYLTRREVSALLRLSERQVDRLAKDGTLDRVKLSPRRSGFDRAGVDAYISRMTAGASKTAASASEAAPHGPMAIGLEFDLGGHSGHRTEYGCRMMLLRIRCEWGAVKFAPVLEANLIDIGIRGALIMADGDLIDIVWAKSLPVTAEQITKAFETIKARATLAA